MKKIIITGAGGGMGHAACRLFSEKGFLVWGLDVNFNKKVPGVKYIECNLTDRQSIDFAVKEISSDTDKIDVILHMAGVYKLNSLIEINDEEFSKIFEVNLFAAYRVNKAFFHMLSAGGRIIITSSELAPLEPLPFTGIYGITKTALEKYAFSLRMETQLLGIKVCVIRPGAVQTPLLSESVRVLDEFCEKTELYPCNARLFKKIVGSVESKNISPEKVAKAALNAAVSKRCKFVYNINRNIFLRLLNALPARLQVYIIGKILRQKNQGVFHI